MEEKVFDQQNFKNRIGNRNNKVFKIFLLVGLCLLVLGCVVVFWPGDSETVDLLEQRVSTTASTEETNSTLQDNLEAETFSYGSFPEGYFKIEYFSLPLLASSKELKKLHDKASVKIREFKSQIRTLKGNLSSLKNNRSADKVKNEIKTANLAVERLNITILELYKSCTNFTTSLALLPGLQQQEKEAKAELQAKNEELVQLSCEWREVDVGETVGVVLVVRLGAVGSELSVIVV